MRTPHHPERRRRKRAASILRRPTPYQKWRGEAYCVIFRGKKRRQKIRDLSPCVSSYFTLGFWDLFF